MSRKWELRILEQKQICAYSRAKQELYLWGGKLELCILEQKMRISYSRAETINIDNTSFFLWDRNMPDDWDKTILYSALYGIRATPSTVTKRSPIHILLERPAFLSQFVEEIMQADELAHNIFFRPPNIHLFLWFKIFQKTPWKSTYPSDAGSFHSDAPTLAGCVKVIENLTHPEALLRPHPPRIPCTGKRGGASGQIVFLEIFYLPHLPVQRILWYQGKGGCLRGCPKIT